MLHEVLIVHASVAVLLQLLWSLLLAKQYKRLFLTMQQRHPNQLNCFLPFLFSAQAWTYTQTATTMATLVNATNMQTAVGAKT